MTTESLVHEALDKHFFLETLRSIGDAIFITDTDFQVLHVNDSFLDVFGFSHEEILGQNARVLFRDEPKSVLGILETTRQSGSWQGEVSHLRKDGSQFAGQLKTSCVRNQAFELLGIVHVVHDNSDRRAMEAELQDAKAAAEASYQEMCAVTEHLEKTTLWAKEMATEAELANVAKSEFLANMSHEIRTPLNAIIGMTELMAESELKPEQQEYLNLINSSSESLLNLINDILDFSKIEAGLLELEETGFDLRQAIEGAVEIFTVRTEHKGIELLSYVDPAIPCRVIGDPTRIRQILVNLIGNAVKFTKQGEIVVKVLFPGGYTPEEDDLRIALHFMVSDSGVGISNQNLDKIFDKFSQADNSTTRKFGGSGLGLSISRSLAELMGGRVWAESELGKGSTFHLELKLPVESRPESDKIHQRIDFRNITVLIVDDNATNRFILRRTLEARGVTVFEAPGASDALQILSDHDKAISLIITDHQMPETDGVRFVEMIRENRRYDEIRIVMLSSMGLLSPSIKKTLDVAAILTKPIRQSNLFEQLQNALVKSNGLMTSNNPEHQTNSSHKQPRRILLVEDNHDNQAVATRILEKNGFSVDVAENGLQGVEAFQNFQYDLILMDIQMPIMDGFQATKAIREYQAGEERERVPIIAVTAHAIEGYREKCLAQDFDEYLPKPIRKRALLSMIDEWLDPRPVVLVAEDNLDNQMLMKKFAKDLDRYRFIYVRNGLDAVKVFKSRSVSLILMDLEMPQVDGFTATKEIRQLGHGASVPIVALTAHSDPKVIRKCFDLGFTDYLAKPFRKQQLLKALDQARAHGQDKMLHAEMQGNGGISEGMGSA